MAQKIEILDSTLRDGAQGEGISYSVQDKLHIVHALDDLGVRYIEAGNPGSNPKDMEFFQKAASCSLKNSELVAFGSTRRKGKTCAEDPAIQSLLSAGTKTVVIFGKAWDMQATEILHASLKENLDMIKDTCAYLLQCGKRVIFDAEHFFTGYAANASYALEALRAAAEGGAEVLCLCETRGGALPAEVRAGVRAAVREFAGSGSGTHAIIGIHTHNDSGLAVANTLQAVEEGATHVQGVLLGFGERCGNAALSTVIPDLELKLGYTCLPAGALASLAPICQRCAEITNIALPPDLPYVGQNAFAHKAGMHIDAVIKNPTSYEHIAPEAVGSSRVFLMSEAAGRSAVLEKIRRFDPSLTRDSPIVNEIIGKVKELEHQGYQFEGADGSFELLVRKISGRYQPFFNLRYYKTSDVFPLIDDGLYSLAQIKIEVEGHEQTAAGEGNGPVNALDIALRAALRPFYPAVADIHLTDYKVRVLDGEAATASVVRVLIESTDGRDTWTTIGVSCDVIQASWLALVDSFEYCLIRDIERRFRRLM